MSAPKTAAPVVGFNHNVKYAGRVYHVQTEDSGLPHAHFITHLFVGGNIVSSLKSSYAESAGQADLPRLIRQQMEQQHKLMLKRLVAGEFNELAERLSTPHYEPGVLASGQTGPAAVNTAAAAPMAAGLVGGAPGKAPPPPPPAPAPQAAPVPTLKPLTPSRLPAVPPLPKVPATAIPRLPRSPGIPVWQPAPPTASPAAPAPRVPGAPLPSTVRAPGAPTRPAAPPRLAPQPVATRPAPAAPRPAAGGGKPAPQLFSDAVVEVPADDLPTLFAEELISEKSLDEVILAFLSTDGEPK